MTYSGYLRLLISEGPNSKQVWQWFVPFGSITQEVVDDFFRYSREVEVDGVDFATSSKYYQWLVRIEDRPDFLRGRSGTSQQTWDMEEEMACRVYGAQHETCALYLHPSCIADARGITVVADTVVEFWPPLPADAYTYSVSSYSNSTNVPSLVSIVRLYRPS